MSKINNVVIYKSSENGKETLKSCIFYADGSVKEGNYNDGLNAVKEAAKEKNITTKKELQEIVNKELFFTMTEEEFREKYNSFLPQISTETIDEVLIGNFMKEEAEEEEPVRFAPRTAICEEEKAKAENDYLSVDNIKEENVVYEEDYDGSYYNDFTGMDYDDIEEEQEETEEEQEEEKKDYIGLKVGAVILGLAAGAVLFTYCNRKSMTGTMENANLPTPTPTPVTTTVDEEETAVQSEPVVIEYNNDLYNDYTYAELLSITQNDFQKNSMINLASTLTGFNNLFANSYLESGNDIKAALSFDEVVALQQAYNSYSKDDIRAYFNGYEIDAVDMSNAYKSASLQLMGAYVIESSENPVDMSILIDSQEGRDFYNKYNAMFIAAKEATGEEQLELVKAFYDAVREDFPITEEERTDGISHSEEYESIKDYQLAVAPMIAAAEMIFQNLDVDYTLDTIENNISEIDFINDIGLCNLADDKFERIETILLGAYEDNENPLFEQYRNAIINDLINNNSYVIDDAHRELANLQRFILIVNGDDGLGYYSTTYTGTYGENYTDSYTYSTTSTSTTTSTETTVTEGEITPEAQAEVDNKINQENDQNKVQAENDATNNAASQQAQEDANAQTIASQVEQENTQTQNDINNINNTINNGGTVNTNDYPNINFSDQYTDSNGNLDNSVQNVTTDGTGANQPLPDPNVTGAQFDAQSANISYTNYYLTSNGYAQWVDTNEGTAFVEYSGDYTQYDANGNPVGYQYTK